MTNRNVNAGESGNSTSLGLLERVKARDQVAWERLVSLYASLVDHWCQRAGLQDADVADLRQEVFLAVARNIDDFHRNRAGDTFRGWLRTITQHRLCDHWRKIGTGLVGRGTPSQERLGQISTPAQDADDSSNAEETGMLYRRALELMQWDFEERSWQAFWRVVIEGQNPKEVAAQLQMTPNAVYLAKGRVLARLREEFAGVIDR